MGTGSDRASALHCSVSSTLIRTYPLLLSKFHAGFNGTFSSIAFGKCSYLNRAFSFASSDMKLFVSV